MERGSHRAVRYLTAILVSCSASGLPAAALSGRVYEGNVGDVGKPLAGVTVSLYGANSRDQEGICIASTTTDSGGFYTLTTRGDFSYFNILQTNLPGYESRGVTTVGGSAISVDWIQYDSASLTGITTDNRFWDSREDPPPDDPGVPAGQKCTHVKWSQPPVEIDPNLEAPPVLCSYIQPSQSTVLADGRQVWNMVADDFRCIGSLPVTGLRWWGFYKGHDKAELPALQPQSWRVTFWRNCPEPADANLFPEKPAWRLDIPFDRVRIEAVGMDGFPRPFSEMCFRFEFAAEPNDWFRPGEFPSEQNIYWISIAAVYPADAPSMNHWGWATRPEVWGDPGRIIVLYGAGPDAQTQLWPTTLMPVASSELCGRRQGYDMAFELLTDPTRVQWSQPFGGLREWPQYADLETRGILMGEQERIVCTVADDWLSDGNAPVVAAAWWGSYLGYGYEACKCDGGPEPPRPDYFLLTISTSAGSDREADDVRPDGAIWQYRAYDYDEVLVGYDRNPSKEPNEPVYRYSVRLPEKDWFHPGAGGGVCWFSVTAIYAESLPAIAYPWGWTNHPHTFGAGAAFIDHRLITEPRWRPLRDAADQPLDMCFTLFMRPQ